MGTFIPGGRLDVRAPPAREASSVKTAIARPVGVGWSWYNEASGLVEWSFHNTSQGTATVVLLRNGYYFGGAFWPVYLAHPSFQTRWATALEPLRNQGVAQNAPPLALLELGASRTVVFAFTLSPGQSWSMLEGGFSANTPPAPQAAPLCSQAGEGEFCVGYLAEAVSQWDQQSGTQLKGYFPNPQTFRTVELRAPGAPSPTLKLFPESVRPGPC